MMDAMFLARLQFAVTTIYHFFFVPLTLGLVILVAILETMYVATDNEQYKRLAKYWGKLFLINFAMGVVTGIVQEFQFGMNWSEFSRFVGDIFGAPLAIEALLAFFLESTFLGIWIFGWDKLSKKMHLACIWLVAIGSQLSAFWILIANSFMQEPQGFVLKNGRAEMVDFFALVQNPHLWFQFPHVIFSGLSTAAFFMIGISAWQLLKTNTTFHKDYVKSFSLAATVGLIGILFSTMFGHQQAQHMIKTQPMKMAAAEALWETADPAPLTLFSIIDFDDKRDIFAIKIPGALSFLAYNQFSGPVQGIKNLQADMEAKHGPGNYIPPVILTFFSFRIMVAAGSAMLGLALLACFLSYKNKIQNSPLILKLFTASLFLPYIANATGWMLAEIGRQPWLVYGVLKTQDGVSPSVTIPMLLISLVVFTLLYGGLMLVDIWLLYKVADRGPITNIEEPI